MDKIYSFESRFLGDTHWVVFSRGGKVRKSVVTVARGSWHKYKEGIAAEFTCDFDSAIRWLVEGN